MDEQKRLKTIINKLNSLTKNKKLMKRTFTFLLTALFLCMGMTVKADIAQKWEKTTVWETDGFDVPDGVTAVAGNFSVALMETSVSAVRSVKL